MGLPCKGSSWVGLKSKANRLPEAFFGSRKQLDLINGEPVGIIRALSKLLFRFSQTQNLLKRSLVWICDITHNEAVLVVAFQNLFDLFVDLGLFDALLL